MGIREMLDEIRNETLLNATQNVENAKAEANRMILSKIDELEKIYKEKRLEFQNELSSIKKKITGKTEMEIFKDLQEKKSNLYNSFINELILAIVNDIRKDKNKYFNFISSVFNDLKKDLKNKDFDVIVSFQDKDIADEIKKKFEVGKVDYSNILGGIIVRTEDTYIDGSFDSIFQKLKPEILKILVSEIGD
ncbi:MAG: V-type ATP synthase subunit E [Brevinematia bacterium]